MATRRIMVKFNITPLKLDNNIKTEYHPNNNERLTTINKK